MRTRLVVTGLALLVLAALIAPSGLDAQEDLLTTLSTMEKGFWEAWKNHDPEPFIQHQVDDYVSVNAWGVLAGKETNIEEFKRDPCDVKSFSFSDWMVHQVSEDTAILTYRAKQNARCGGEKLPENVISSAVYVRQNGNWRLAAYHEVRAEM